MQGELLPEGSQSDTESDDPDTEWKNLNLSTPANDSIKPLRFPPTSRLRNSRRQTTRGSRAGIWTGVPRSKGKKARRPGKHYIPSETEYERGPASPTTVARLPDPRPPKQFTLEKLESVTQIREWLDLLVVIARTHYLHTFLLTRRVLTREEGLKLQYDPVSFLLGESF